MTDISRLNAKDVLEESHLQEYEERMNFFFSELVELNTIIYLTKQIIEFPLDLFGMNRSFFLSMVMGSFHNTAILIVTRLLTDQSAHAFTLKVFKNRVRGWVKVEFKDNYYARLKKVRFDAEIKALLQTAKDLRDNRVAHLDQNMVSGKVKVFRPTLIGLEKIREALNSLFSALSFNQEWVMLPLEYSPKVLRPNNTQNATDIDRILDGIARSSALLNMPEQRPNSWPYRKPHLTKDQLDKLNLYRVKFGMPEV